ncbi:MAG TPA: lipopolysaccharide biosynthesis protein [Longimicrobiales bacterium]
MSLRTVGKHTAIYGLGVAIGKLASFLMLPIYTHYLTPADYGILELLSMTVDVIATIAGMGIAGSVFKFYADCETREEQDRVISTAAIAMTAVALVTALLGLAASPALTRIVLGPDVDPRFFRIFFLIYLAQTCEVVPLLLVRVLHRSRLFVLLNVGKLIAMLSLNIYFVVGRRMGVLGVLLSNLIATTIFGVGVAVFAFRRAGFRFSSEKFVAMARFGSPMILWTLGNFVLVFSDRYFLQHVSGPAAVGIYSLAYKFAFVLAAFAFTPFRMVWEHYRFTIAKQPNAQEVYTRTFTYMNLAVGSVALVIALFTPDLLRVMADPAFLPAQRLVPWLLAAQIIFGWVSFANLGLFLKERTGKLSLVSASCVVVVTVLNLLLIPRFGVLGAAAATLAAYALRFCGVYYFSQREYRIEYPWSAVGKIYGVLVAAVLVRNAFDGLPIPASLALGSGLAAASFAALYRQVLTAAERELVRRSVLRPWRVLSLVATRG